MQELLLGFLVKFSELPSGVDMEINGVNIVL